MYQQLSWPGGRGLALSIVVNVEEGSEMTVKDGDKKVGDVVEATAKELGDEIKVTRFARFAIGDSKS